MPRRLLWLPLALAACASAPSAPSDALELLVAQAPATLDPRFTTDAVAMRITRLVHAGLVRLDPSTLEPRPYLASGWSWESPSALRVELRPGLRFASGAPFESADVCATIDALADPRLASPHRSLVTAIERCAPLGPDAVRLSLREPRATLLTDLELPIFRRDQAAAPAGAALDNLGPFSVAEASHGVVRLAARAGGALPRPPRDVIVRAVHDENARTTRLLAGKADIVPNAISPPQLAALAERGVRIDARPGANLTYLLVHNGRRGLDDVRTRRALGMAIDREKLVATLFGGRARVAHSFLPPESWAFAAPSSTLPFDPDQARSHLAAARLGRVSLLCSTDRQRITAARAVAQMLGDAGLDVDLSPLDLGVMIHRLSAGDYELAIVQIPELTEPNLLRWFFHSSSIPAPGKGGANRARYASADADALLDQAASTPDQAARAALYRGLLARMLDDLPVVPLFHEDQVAALSPRAAAFRLSAEGRWLALASPD